MANQMSKFIPNLAPNLSETFYVKIANGPGISHNKKPLIQLLLSPPVLALYDPNARTIVSVLLHEQTNENGIHLALMERYAQIEKEALAFTWTCDDSHWFQTLYPD